MRTTVAVLLCLIASAGSAAERAAKDPAAA